MLETLACLKMQIVTSAGKERLSRCSLELKLSQKCREEGTQALRPLWVNHTAASVDRPEEVEPYKDGRGLHNTFLTCQSLNEKIIWYGPTHNPWHMNIPAMNHQRLRSHRVSQKSEYWDSSGIFLLLIFTSPYYTLKECWTLCPTDWVPPLVANQLNPVTVISFLGSLEICNQFLCGKNVLTACNLSALLSCTKNGFSARFPLFGKA